jgi:membrane associated rhomboid family serine protease
MQVFNVGAVTEVRTGGVAYLAHIAGFLFGALTARMFVDRQRIVNRSRAYY